MSRPISRLAFQLASPASRPTPPRAVRLPCRKALLRPLSTPLCAGQAVRTFTTSPNYLKKAGKANKGHARSDSSPPVSDLSASTSTDEAYDVSILEAKILKAMEHLTHELSQLRSGGRFNPELVESLKVQLGTVSRGKESVRLSEIAQVVPKGRLLNIMVAEKEYIKPISSAIAASSHNLAPQQPHPDSPLTIPVPIPPPTGESRMAALDMARKAAEQADRAIQDARAAHHKKLRKFQLEKLVLPDDLQKATKRMEEVVKKGHTEVKRIVDGAKRVLESQ
ncbi:ribosome recycling factor [Lindgomyces ingoldianus]|uniref:Ribosome recycling factor n=1 Tax=Lindgomyces ingoldianus TaxID=673940 RepID=A0ACB6QYD4_9PLEO|nr:ribosome recycling factor [Lindgomyces ingoldianus]KAF2471870.1 ribosome recycling factor [Lindgomyces ingoldianus]